MLHRRQAHFNYQFSHWRLLLELSRKLGGSIYLLSVGVVMMATQQECKYGAICGFKPQELGIIGASVLTGYFLPIDSQLHGLEFESSREECAW